MDSGLAAATNFVGGIAVVRHAPDPTHIAAYSLLVTGWFFLQIIPAQTCYLPSRLHINRHQTIVRTRLGSDFVRAVPISALAATLCTLTALPLLNEFDQTDFIIISASVFPLVVLSPFQDHVRRTCHVIAFHWTAVAVSGITGIVAIAGVLLAVALQLPIVPCTLASLAFGNAVGAIHGLNATRKVPAVSFRSTFSLQTAKFAGPDLANQGGGYLVGAVTAGMLGASAVAQLEVARLIASPVNVIAGGVSAALIPAVARTFSTGNRKGFRRALRLTLSCVLVISALYLIAIFVLRGPLKAGLNISTGIDLGIARAFVASIDASATGVALILFLAGRTSFWTAVSVLAPLVILVLVIPGALLFGVWGVIAAQAIGTSLRAALGVRATWQAESKPND